MFISQNQQTGSATDFQFHQHRLNERGGLSPSEMLRILEDRDWSMDDIANKRGDDGEHDDWLSVKAYLNAWREKQL